MGGHKPSSINQGPGLLRDRDPRSQRDERNTQSASGCRSVAPHRERSEDQTGLATYAASRFGWDRECISRHPWISGLDDLSSQQALLTALSPVLLSLTNLTTLDMSPTTGASTAQVQEELVLCQTWSKYCGLQKVVFPSGDVWKKPSKGPEFFGESGGWILVGGDDVTSSPSSSASKSRRSSSEFSSTNNVAGGHNPSEGIFSVSHISVPNHGSHTTIAFCFERSDPITPSTPTAIPPMMGPKKKTLGQPCGTA